MQEDFVEIDYQKFYDLIRSTGKSIEEFCFDHDLDYSDIYDHINLQIPIPFEKVEETLKEKGILLRDVITDLEEDLEYELRYQQLCYYRELRFALMAGKITYSEFTKHLSEILPYLLPKRIAINALVELYENGKDKVIESLRLQKRGEDTPGSTDEDEKLMEFINEASEV